MVKLNTAHSSHPIGKARLDTARNVSNCVANRLDGSFDFLSDRSRLMELLKSTHIPERIPRGALVTGRENIRDVDSPNFYYWSMRFVRLVKLQHNWTRNVFLIYDYYQSLVSRRVIELLGLNNIIVYALQSHKFGKTKPCDTELFGSFMQALNRVVSSLTGPELYEVEHVRILFHAEDCIR